MAISSFPKGWKILSGTLGTDIDVVTSPAISGGTAFHWPAGAAADAVIVSDWIPITQSVFSTANKVSFQSFGVALIARASSVAANKDIQIVFEAATQDKTTINTSTVYSGALTTINTWEVLPDIKDSALYGTNAHWIRIKINRPSDINFDLYLDSVELKQTPAGIMRFGGGSGAFTTAWATIPIGSAIAVYNETVTWDAVNHQAQIHYPGVYQLNANVIVEGAQTAGDTFGIRLSVNTGVPAFLYGSSISRPVTTVTPFTYSMNVSHCYEFTKAFGLQYSTVEIQVIQGGGHAAANWEQPDLTITRVSDR